MTPPDAGRVWNPNVDDLHNYILELEAKVTTHAETIRRLEESQHAENQNWLDDRAVQLATIRRLEGELRAEKWAATLYYDERQAQCQRAEAAEGRAAFLEVCVRNHHGPEPHEHVATGEGAK